jgi:hypothetical protein
MSMTDDEYTNIILEEMNGKFDVVMEAFTQIQETMKTFATKDELKTVAHDVKIIKKAVTATNKDVQNHEVRITCLEQAA